MVVRKKDFGPTLLTCLFSHQLQRFGLSLSSLVANMKINFAPYDVPLHRRLQTAVVLQWVFSFLGLAPTCIFLFFYLLFTRYWLISVLYAIWWYIDYDTPSRGGRRVPFLCGIKVWAYMRDYFPIKVRH
ncbi:hypothetical protein LDENG_00122660 [Lucifuga dentata]|nr:hypothetical protein LDENG_00122660 [Lucifuga dentata]